MKRNQIRKPSACSILAVATAVAMAGQISFAGEMEGEARSDSSPELIPAVGVVYHSASQIEGQLRLFIAASELWDLSQPGIAVETAFGRTGYRVNLGGGVLDPPWMLSSRMTYSAAKLTYLHTWDTFGELESDQDYIGIELEGFWGLPFVGIDLLADFYYPLDTGDPFFAIGVGFTL